MTDSPHPSSSNGERNRPPVRGRFWGALLFLSVVAIIVLARTPFVQTALQKTIWNVDELEMTYATLGRYAGVPSTTLAKPGGPLQMATTPLVAVMYLASGFPRNALGFLDFLGAQFLQPWGVLLAMRWVVSIVSAVAVTAWLWGNVRRFGWMPSCIGALLLLTWPAFALHAHLAVPDALALGLVAGALTGLNCIENNHQRSLWTGILFGLAMAAKLTMMVLLPWLLVLAWDSRGKRLAPTLVLLLGVAIGFLIGCPQVWMEPLRLAKTVLGNATKPGTMIGFSGAGQAFLEICPIWMLIPVGVSLVRAAGERRLMYVATILLAFVLLLYSGVRAAVFFSRYYFPLLLPFALLIVEESRRWTVARSPDTGPPGRAQPCSVVIVATLILAALNMKAYLTEARQSPAWNRDAVALADDLLGEPNETRMMLPGEMLPYVVSRCSQSSLERFAERAMEMQEHAAGLSHFAAQRNVAAELVRVIPNAFSEREQAFIAQLRLMVHAAPEAGMDMSFWHEDNVAARGGFYTQTEVRQLDDSAPYDRIILSSPLPNRTALASYGDSYWVYSVSAKTPARP